MRLKLNHLREGHPFPTWYRISGFLAIVTIALFLPWVITHGSGAVLYEGRVSLGVISGGHFLLCDIECHTSLMNGVYHVNIGALPKMADGLGTILQPLKVTLWNRIGISCVTFEVGNDDLGSVVHPERTCSREGGIILRETCRCCLLHWLMNCQELWRAEGEDNMEMLAYYFPQLAGYKRRRM